MMTITERMLKVEDDCVHRNYKRATHYKITSQKAGILTVMTAYSLNEVTTRMNTLTRLGYTYIVTVE